MARAVLCLAALSSLLAGAQTTDLPPNSGRTATIDGKPLATDGKVVGVEGRTLIIDGKPVLVDGRPLAIDGKTVVIDGRTVVRNGVLTQPVPRLVFTIDLRWLGQSSYRVERDVTTPIERAVKTLPGVLDVHSTVLGGRAQTRVAFDSKTDASTTATAIRTRLDQIKMRLPRDASQPLIAWQRETPAP